MTISQNGSAKSMVHFSEFELDNGLKVILSKDSSIPSVVINLCYHVGSKDEEPDKTGYAHLFEHLMFEGSKNVPPGDYDRLSLLAGGENNAYTNEDKTNYYIVLPSNQLEFGLWLESDRMLEFAVSEEALETQKGVVIEEKKQMFDNRPYGSVSLEFAPKLFPISNYRWDTIGEDEHIENASLSDIRDFYNKFYVPNNVVLSIVGDIDIEDTKNLVNEYFGSIPRGTQLHKQEFRELPLTGETRKVIHDNIQLPGLFMGYRIPEETSKEFYTMDILSDILSTGDSSRFYNELVYEKQIASEIGCYVDGKEFSGVFYIYAILMPGRTIEELETEIDKIFDDVKAGKLLQNELQKIKNRIESRNAYRLQTILAKAELLTHYKIFYKDANLINTNIHNYMNINLEDIKNSTVKFLNKDNRVVLHYLPKPNLN